ncbi:hypothetical protein LWI29_017831 [Acer saccharum]|uniref:CCHC-type domain-containing protein n=1 Tax=Acer saccharum TaxID=4024 RepID=A0AA39TEY6_ACESA|nr:hypothetical protein LWI29_017831 [Acer saccharum]
MTSEGNFVQSATNGNFVQPAIPRFNGHYDHWSILMENFLRSKEYWSLVETGYVEPEDVASLTDAQQKKLEEEKLKDLKKFHRHNVEEQALKVTFEDRAEGRGRGRGFFRGRGRGRGRQSFNKALVECYKCHKLGHFQYECPSWDKEANYAELGEEKEMLLMSYVEMNEAKREDMVKLGNNSRMTVMGKGNVRLKVNGLTHVVTEVFFVPDLKNNLLSIGQLQEKGLAILIKHGLCRIYHPTKGLLIQTAMSANRMFILLAASQPKQVVAVLEWGDNDEEVAVSDEIESEDGDIAEEVENVSPDTVDEGRIRR